MGDFLANSRKANEFLEKMTVFMQKMANKKARKGIKVLSANISRHLWLDFSDTIHHLQFSNFLIHKSSIINITGLSAAKVEAAVFIGGFLISLCNCCSLSDLFDDSVFHFL